MMKRDKTYMAIIAARGGSKRLPNKNIIEFAGKPLIAWTIEAGLNCKFFDKVIVTTDDEKIADVSKEFGAEAPFLRPKELATDSAKSEDVIIHAVNYYKEKNETFENIVLLQPTSPLRDAVEIENAIDFFIKRNASAVVSVNKVDHSPLWMNTLPENLSMNNFLREDIKGIRSQELPQYYQLNGAINICRTEIFVKEKTFFLNDNLFAYIMPKEKSVDIDTEFDLKFAEYMFYQSNHKKN